MSKGSNMRPRRVSTKEWEDNWAQTFGPRRDYDSAIGYDCNADIGWHGTAEDGKIVLCGPNEDGAAPSWTARATAKRMGVGVGSDGQERIDMLTGKRMWEDISAALDEHAWRRRRVGALIASTKSLVERLRKK